MEYTTGDRLKFTGISGNYSTVKTDIPESDKTITFNFIACTDGDNNNYPVVEIGTQVWMAENLKTTKYSDGTDIPLVTSNTAWIPLTTPGYCWYNNNEATTKTPAVVCITGTRWMCQAIVIKMFVRPAGMYLSVQNG